MPFDRGIDDRLGEVEKLLDTPGARAAILPAAAAATAYEVAVYKAASGVASDTVSKVSLLPAAAIGAGGSTDFQTLTLRQWRAGAVVRSAGVAGGTPVTTVAAKVAFTEYPLFAGTLVLQPGDVLTVRNTTAGAGEALPAITVSIESSPSASGALDT